MEGRKLSMQNLQGFCQKYRVLWNWLNYYFPYASSFLHFDFFIVYLKFKFQKALLGSWRELACFYFYY